MKFGRRSFLKAAGGVLGGVFTLTGCGRAIKPQYSSTETPFSLPTPTEVPNNLTKLTNEERNFLSPLYDPQSSEIAMMNEELAFENINQMFFVYRDAYKRAIARNFGRNSALDNNKLNFAILSEEEYVIRSAAILAQRAYEFGNTDSNLKEYFKSIHDNNTNASTIVFGQGVAYIQVNKGSKQISEALQNREYVALFQQMSLVLLEEIIHADTDFIPLQTVFSINQEKTDGSNITMTHATGLSWIDPVTGKGLTNLEEAAVSILNENTFTDITGINPGLQNAYTGMKNLLLQFIQIANTDYGSNLTWNEIDDYHRTANPDAFLWKLFPNNADVTNQIKYSLRETDLNLDTISDLDIRRSYIEMILQSVRTQAQEGNLQQITLSTSPESPYPTVPDNINMAKTIKNKGELL